MSMLARFMARLIIGLLLLTLMACATGPEAPDPMAAVVDDPNNGLTTEQRMQLLMMENNDWNLERQREQQIWNRMMPQPQPIYVVPRY